MPRKKRRQTNQEADSQSFIVLGVDVCASVCVRVCVCWLVGCLVSLSYVLLRSRGGLAGRQQTKRIVSALGVGARLCAAICFVQFNLFSQPPSILLRCFLLKCPC